jgi:hypothetical protein
MESREMKLCVASDCSRHRIAHFAITFFGRGFRRWAQIAREEEARPIYSGSKVCEQSNAVFVSK